MQSLLFIKCVITVQTTKKSEKRHSSTRQFPVEVYLFYLKNTKKSSDLDSSEFFNELSNLEDNIDHSLVFLNPQSALQHSRFIQKNHMVFKAYIPHVAIEGRISGLSLKKGFVKKTCLHGCFPAPTRDSLYIENPHFDTQNYPSFLHSH